MDDFLNAIKQAIQDRNWHAALALSLILPDICGWLETPTKSTSRRYVDWCRKYLQPAYTSNIGASGKETIFLTAEDTYALRCALLHEGRESIMEQRIRKALTRFRFTEPPPRGFVHCNLWNDKVLQLQVDIFCSDMIHGVEQWLGEIFNSSASANRRSDLLLRVHKSSSSPFFGDNPAS